MELGQLMLKIGKTSGPSEVTLEILEARGNKCLKALTKVFFCFFLLIGIHSMPG